jgi:hypothetical protein
VGTLDPWGCGTIALIAICIEALTASAGVAIAGPLDSSDPLDAGYRQMYDLQFDAARKSFGLWQRSHPDDPFADTSLAAADLFSEFNRLHVFEVEMFVNDAQFMTRDKFDANPAIVARFERELGDSERLAAVRLERNPRDSNALLAQVLNQGLEGDDRAMIEARGVAALSNLKRSARLGEQLLSYHPECFDAYLAVGFENYLLGSSPFFVRWVVWLYGGETDFAAGLKDLQLTADRGHYLAPYARMLLAVAALRANDNAQAIALLDGLAREFPHNHLYRDELRKLRDERGKTATQLN